MAQPGYRAGDNPKRNQGGSRKVTYGQRGLKRGVPKDQQARNQPSPGGANPDDGDPSNDVPETIPADLSYLSDKQQAAVEKWLGESYDPSKPLNVQLFKARWQSATQAERREMATKLSGEWLEGGPAPRTLQAFHTEYIGALKQQNELKAKELEQRIEDYSQNFGGYASTQEAADASLAYWTDFAATAAGQAHIAETGMTVDQWLAGQAASSQTGVDNYASQSQYWSGVQQTAAALGQDVPGFKPPGWASTLASIQAGTAPVPSVGGTTWNMYPGIAGDLAGIDPNLWKEPVGHGRGTQDTGGGGGMPNTQGNASLYPVYTPQTLGGTHPSITGFDYNEMVGEVFG